MIRILFTYPTCAHPARSANKTRGGSRLCRMPYISSDFTYVNMCHVHMYPLLRPVARISQISVNISYVDVGVWKTTFEEVPPMFRLALCDAVVSMSKTVSTEFREVVIRERANTRRGKQVRTREFTNEFMSQGSRAEVT